MSGLNRAQLIGRLGRDPETRRTQAGDPVVTFSMATSETWKDKTSGERKERTEWHNIVIFNENLGRIAEAYLRKGSQAYISGQIRTREYTDRDGNQRRVTEIVLPRFDGDIVLLGDARGAAGEDSYGQTRARPAIQHDDKRMAMGDPAPNRAPPRASDVIDDEIPF